MANLDTTAFQKEVDENAFLVSKTDIHGHITYCNEPFLKIVATTEENICLVNHTTL